MMIMTLWMSVRMWTSFIITRKVHVRFSPQNSSVAFNNIRSRFKGTTIGISFPSSITKK